MTRYPEINTRYFARFVGDRAFIEWLVERLIHIYKENADIDFIHTLKRFAEAGDIIKQIKDKLDDHCCNEGDNLAEEALEIISSIGKI